MIAPIQRICHSPGLWHLSLSQQVDANAFGKPNQCVASGQIFASSACTRGRRALRPNCNRLPLSPFALLRFHIGVCGPLCARAATIWSGGPQSGQRSHSRPTLSSQSQGCVLRCVRSKFLSLCRPLSPLTHVCELCNSITAVTIAHNERQTHFSCLGAHVNNT